MDVEISGRRVRVTEVMRRHIRQHINRLPRFDDKIQYLTVTLAVDSGDQLVEIIAKCHRANLVAEARGHDMYQSIDDAFAKMERRISRYHGKLVSNRARGAQRGPEASERAR